MKNQHPNTVATVQARKEQFEKFRIEVETLELSVRKNKAQKELMAVAVDSRIDAFQDIEINLMERHPELVPTVVEERNMFLKTVGIPVDVYEEYLKKEIAAREQANKQRTENPSDQLHAIAEQIKEEPITPEVAAEITAELSEEEERPVIPMYPEEAPVQLEPEVAPMEPIAPEDDLPF